MKSLSLALLLAFAGVVHADEIPEVPARAADTFVDSVGVNVHLHYRDTPYEQFDKLKAALLDLGIRHVRDGFFETQWQGYYDRHNELGRAGIRGQFIASAHADGPTAWNPRPDQIATVIDRLGDSIEAVEGTNEPNLFLKSEDWAKQTRLHQSALYAAVKNHPKWNSLAVVAPSIIFNAQPAVGDLSAFCDYGNSHPYPGGRPQSANLADELRKQRLISGDKPMFITETGYHAALRHENGHRPTSEAVEAKYLPRLFLTTFDAGVVRTFDYELIDTFNRGDTDPESNFGLLRSDFTPRPAYVALKNLLGLLAGPGDAFEPQPLRMRLETAEGGALPESARFVLLQKRDGRHYLCVWNDAKSWDEHTVEPIEVPAVPVRLRLAKSATVVEHRPSSPEWPLRRSEGEVGEWSFDLLDEVTVLELAPAAVD